MNKHELLQAAMDANGIRAIIVAQTLYDDRTTGAGLIDCFTVGLAVEGQPVFDVTGTLFRPAPEMHEHHGETKGTGSFAVPVDSHEQAQIEAARYDPVPLLASYVFNLWQGSMPPWDYHPGDAHGGPYQSYGHYQIAMLRQDRFISAIGFATQIGEERYEAIEKAVIADRARDGSPIYPAVEISRFQFIRGLLIRDPNHNISAAVFADLVPAELSQHREDDDRNLACPFCNRLSPRADLAIVSYPEVNSAFNNVAWGCRNCVGGYTAEITLDRMRTAAEAMRWTLHMLDKPHMQHPVAVRGWIASISGIFGEEVGLWADGPI